jgi:hypothetical protein
MIDQRAAGMHSDAVLFYSPFQKLDLTAASRAMWVFQKYKSVLLAQT